MPDDAVVPLADDELEGACVPAVRAPRARKLGSAARDEGAEPQDLFVSQSAMRLPAAGRAYACAECAEMFDKGTVSKTQELFEGQNR